MQTKIISGGASILGEGLELNMELFDVASQPAVPPAHIKSILVIEDESGWRGAYGFGAGDKASVVLIDLALLRQEKREEFGAHVLNVRPDLIVMDYELKLGWGISPAYGDALIRFLLGPAVRYGGLILANSSSSNQKLLDAGAHLAVKPEQEEEVVPFGKIVLSKIFL